MYVPAIYVPPSVVYPSARISLRVYDSSCALSLRMHVPSVYVLFVCMSPPWMFSPFLHFFFWSFLHLYIASMYISLRVYAFILYLPSVCMSPYVSLFDCFYMWNRLDRRSRWPTVAVNEWVTVAVGDRHSRWPDRRDKWPSQLIAAAAVDDCRSRWPPPYMT